MNVFRAMYERMDGVYALGEVMYIAAHDKEEAIEVAKKDSKWGGECGFLIR